MLPFLQPKKLSGSIIAKTNDAGEIKDEHKEDETHPGLMAAAEDLIAAVHAKDANGVAQAMQAAYDILDAKDESESEEGAV